MELSGNLKDFLVEYIIKFLSLSKRTGVLNIDGKDIKGEEVKGKIFFDNGKVINAEGEGKKGEDTLFHLLTARSGNFSFLRKDVGEVERTINKDTKELLFEASKRIKLIEEIIKRLPPFDIVLELNPNPSSVKISLGKSEWSILNLFRGGKSIKQVIKESSYSEAETLSAILSLFASGLLIRKEINIDEVVPKKNR